MGFPRLNCGILLAGRDLDMNTWIAAVALDKMRNIHCRTNDSDLRSNRFSGGVNELRIIAVITDCLSLNFLYII